MNLAKRKNEGRMNKIRKSIWRTKSCDFLCFTLTVREDAFIIQRAAANIKEDCNHYTEILEDMFNLLSFWVLSIDREIWHGLMILDLLMKSAISMICI